MKVGLVGNGYLGQAYARVFPEAPIYDPGKGLGTKEEINRCDIAFVMVPTDPMPDGSLNTSIVEEVVGWLETPLILIKSALNPGTVDRLVERTGKRIAVSLEYIGMGNYYFDPSRYPDPLDPQKHNLIVVGGEKETAEACANVLWTRMSPATRIHILSAKEVEICKLIENFYGSMKVTFANCLYSLVNKSEQSYIKVHQAWSEDGRTDPMHTKVNPDKRGWSSHCWNKDVMALKQAAVKVNAKDMVELVDTVIKLNEVHLSLNEKNPA